MAGAKQIIITKSKNCQHKALITLKEVNTSDVEKRKNLHEKIKQTVINLTLLFNSLILSFFMMLDTCNKQFDISYIISLVCVNSETHYLQFVSRPEGRGVLPYMDYYSYVQRQRFFLAVFGLKQGINFDHFFLV